MKLFPTTFPSIKNVISYPSCNLAVWKCHWRKQKSLKQKKTITGWRQIVVAYQYVFVAYNFQRNINLFNQTFYCSIQLSIVKSKDFCENRQKGKNYLRWLQVTNLKHQKSVDPTPILIHSHFPLPYKYTWITLLRVQ